MSSFRYSLNRSCRTLSSNTSNSVFSAASSQFLASAATVASIPGLQGWPEVAIVGRANVGKSTLVNAVLQRYLGWTSKKAVRMLVDLRKKYSDYLQGRTRALNFFSIGKFPRSFVLVDSPGYGARGRPEWGEVWNHYVDNRRQLRQICILINSKHGVTKFDQAMLKDLHARLSSRANVKHAPVIQPILTKIDTLTGEIEMKKISQDIIKHAPTAKPPILTTITPVWRIGIEAVKDSMVHSCKI